MTEWLYTLPFLAIMGIVMYLGYRRGYVVSKSIAAVLFMFHPSKDGDRVTVNSCSGWVQHAGRSHERGTYEFTFDAQLTNGDAEVILLDRNKQQLVKLNRWFPAKRVELDAKSRYYIRWEFKSATGKCELRRCGKQE